MYAIFIRRSRIKRTIFFAGDSPGGRGEYPAVVAAAEDQPGPVAVVINKAVVTFTRSAVDVAESDWTGLIDTPSHRTPD